MLLPFYIYVYIAVAPYIEAPAHVRRCELYQWRAQAQDPQLRRMNTYL